MRNISLGIALALFALLLVSPAVRADGVVLTLESGISAGAGSTGNAFDVLLSNTGAASVSLGAFTFGITTSDTDITFTDANTSTSAPYVFAGDSFVVISGFPLFINTLPGQTVEASDLSNSGAGAIIAAGTTVALGSIVFDVASGATPGTFGVNFESFPTTSLADPLGVNVNFTSADGTITITNTTPVPEPAASDLLICALAMVGFATLIRRYRTSLALRVM